MLGRQDEGEVCVFEGSVETGGDEIYTCIELLPSPEPALLSLISMPSSLDSTNCRLKVIMGKNYHLPRMVCGDKNGVWPSLRVGRPQKEVSLHPPPWCVLSLWNGRKACENRTHIGMKKLAPV